MGLGEGQGGQGVAKQKLRRLGDVPLTSPTTVVLVFSFYSPGICRFLGTVGFMALRKEWVGLSGMDRSHM